MQLSYKSKRVGFCKGFRSGFRVEQKRFSREGMVGSWCKWREWEMRPWLHPHCEGHSKDTPCHAQDMGTAPCRGCVPAISTAQMMFQCQANTHGLFATQPFLSSKVSFFLQHPSSFSKPYSLLVDVSPAGMAGIPMQGTPRDTTRALFHP